MSVTRGPADPLHGQVALAKLMTTICGYELAERWRADGSAAR